MSANPPRDVMVLTAAAGELQAALAPLKARGMNAREVQGAFRFVAVFAARPAELALLDLEGLERRDLEALRVIREIRPDVAVVALMNIEQRGLANAALAEGADIYLVKPVAAPELEAAMDRALRLRRAVAFEDRQAAPGERLADLALAVAHEVNNPLTTISGWLQVLGEDYRSDKRLAKVLVSLQEESDRIRDAVAQLLLFAQGQPPRREPTDMGRLLAQLSRNHAEAFARKGIRLISRIEPGLPPVKGDEQQLIQACEGLLEDAEAGLRSGGEIEISCQRAEGGVEVTLVDNGRPIPPERLAKVFQPFQQGRATNGHRVPLSASYGIIRSHGGRVRVQSDESLGTRFSVWLPCE